MKIRGRSLLVFSAAILSALSPFAGELSDDARAHDLEELFGSNAAERLDAPRPAWRPSRGTIVWIDRSIEHNPMLMEFDPASGDRRILLASGGLQAGWGDRHGHAPTLEDPVWRPDGSAVLLTGGGGPVLVDLATSNLRSLSVAGAEVTHPQFSPGGDRIAWVRDNDLYVYDLETDRELRLTRDGSETIFNGVFDWVYEEELAGRDGRAYAWAADGSAIVWLRLDDGAIPVHHLVDLLGTHSRITRQRYPKPGDPTPAPSLHVTRFDTGEGPTRVADFDFDAPLPYVPRFGFTPDGDLWYQVIDRGQDMLDLVHVDLESGARSVLIHETDPYWVEPVNGVRFLDDGSFLWLSRRAGNTRLYRIRPDGAPVDLSPGPADVTEILGLGPAGDHVFYQAARPSPKERHLYRVEVESGETTKLTNAIGTHSGSLSVDGRLLITSSSLVRPPHRYVTDTHGRITTEIPVEHPIPRIDYADHRFVEVTADDGIILNGLVLFPPGFDASKQHPVVVFTYGGPHAQVATNSWPRTSGLFNHTLANRGFVVFALDNRGSAARGREFEGATDLGLGSKQLPDQLAGVRWLEAQGWADPDRIGIWGWSYGGYMSALALTHAPGTFAAGAAVAPVTDWRLYDSVYTERYMGTPEANPAGYAAGSVLDAIGRLTDPLLVIHGTGDDNVHVQHSIQLADQAWRNGVRFDLMLMPNLAHGINAPGSHLRIFSAITDFFVEHLMEEEKVLGIRY